MVALTQVSCNLTLAAYRWFKQRLLTRCRIGGFSTLRRTWLRPGAGTILYVSYTKRMSIEWSPTCLFAVGVLRGYKKQRSLPPRTCRWVSALVRWFRRFMSTSSDTYSNILYVREKKAELSHLAHVLAKVRSDALLLLANLVWVLCFVPALEPTVCDVWWYDTMLYLYDLQLATVRRLGQVDKFSPEVCCVIGNYYSLKVKRCLFVNQFHTCCLNCCTISHAQCKHEKAVINFQRAVKMNRRYLSGMKRPPAPPVQSTLIRSFCFFRMLLRLWRWYGYGYGMGTGMDGYGW